MDTINLLDSFVNTKENISIHYSLNNDNNFNKMCKIFKIKTGYATGKIFKAMLRVSSVCIDSFEDTILNIRTQLGKESANRAFNISKKTSHFTIYYKWNVDEIEVYIKMNKEYCVIDVQLLQGESDLLIFNTNLMYEVPSVSLIEIKPKETNRFAIVSLENGFTAYNNINRLEREENIINIRLDVTGNIVSNAKIGTMPASYRPSAYQDITCFCMDSNEVVLQGQCIVRLAYGGDITIISAPQNSYVLKLTHTHIANIKI